MSKQELEVLQREKQLFNLRNEEGSSEEEYDDDEEEETLDDTKPLLSRLLSLDSPDLTEKMVELLLKEGAIELMLEHLTRLNPNVKIPEKYEELPFRQRDTEDMSALKMSYNCMDLLCGANKNVARILQGKFRIIVTKIFDVFKYNSDGNFHHFRKIFENLLRFKPIEILDTILLSKDDTPPLVLSMLDYLDESPVSASLGTILFFPLKLSASEMERKKRINHFLESQQLIKRIVKRISYSDSQAAAASDFLVRVIDECTRIESSEVITSSMRDIDNSIVEWLFEIINSRDPKIRNAQRLGCFNVLNSLLVKSSPKEFEIPVNTSNSYTPTIQKTPNGLHDLNEPTKIKVIQQFTNIAEILHKESQTKKGKSKHFPGMRLAALESMCEAIKDLENLGHTFSQLPAYFWKMLVDWFFQYSYNNVYHSVFYKLVVYAIKTNNTSTLNRLFVKTKFIGRMIETYQDQSIKSGCRGYILLICNFLRLSKDSQKSSEYIPTMLSSHHAWNNFLVTLRQDTMMQVTLQVKDDESFIRPMPHTGPSVTPQEEEEMVSFLARVLKSGDIDIGSQYAYSLGFTGGTYEYYEDEEQQPVETNKKKKKKNKNKRNSQPQIQMQTYSQTNSEEEDDFESEEYRI